MAAPGARGVGLEILPWAETPAMRPAAERRMADVYSILMDLIFIVKIEIGIENLELFGLMK